MAAFDHAVMIASPAARPELERIRLPEDASFACKAVGGRRFTAPFHHHAEIELTAVHAGHGQRFIGDTVEDFRPGDVVLIGPHLPHAWFCAASCRRAQATVVQFHVGTLGAGVLAAPEMRGVRDLIQAAERGLVLSSSFAGMVQRLESLPATARLPELLRLLVEMTADDWRPLNATSAVQTVSIVDRERLSKALRHLHEHHAQPVKLADLARCTGLGPEAFSRFFRRVTGRTFIETLTHIRLASALTRLRESGDKIAAIAAACGFEDVSNFNRQFRRRYGCAPGTVRKRGE